MTGAPALDVRYAQAYEWGFRDFIDRAEVRVYVPADIHVEARLSGRHNICVRTPGSAPFVQGGLWASAEAVRIERVVENGDSLALITIVKTLEAQWDVPVTEVDQDGMIDPYSAYTIARALIGSDDGQRRTAGWLLLDEVARRGFWLAIVDLYRVMSRNPKEADKAMAMLMQALAHHQHPLGLYELGKALVQAGDEEGFAYLTQAAEAGLLEARVELGLLLSPLSLMASPEKNAEEAAKWLIAAASDPRVSPAALLCLSMMFRDGCGVDRDIPRARALHRRAQQAGEVGEFVEPELTAAEEVQQQLLREEAGEATPNEQPPEPPWRRFAAVGAAVGVMVLLGFALGRWRSRRRRR